MFSQFHPLVWHMLNFIFLLYCSQILTLLRRVFKHCWGIKTVNILTKEERTDHNIYVGLCLHTLHKIHFAYSPVTVSEWNLIMVQWLERWCSNHKVRRFETTLQHLPKFDLPLVQYWVFEKNNNENLRIPVRASYTAQSTYIYTVEYRAVSGVFRTIDLPHTLHPASVSSARTKGGGVHTQSPGGEGVGGQ